VATSTSLMKSGLTAAFVLARVFAADAAGGCLCPGAVAVPGPKSRGHIKGHAAGIGPRRGPKSHVVAACLNAGERMSIELGIASKYPPRPMIAL
jgi:hypothetical protein